VFFLLNLGFLTSTQLFLHVYMLLLTLWISKWVLLSFCD